MAIWEAVEESVQRSYKKASSSTNPPQSSKQGKSKEKKRARQEEKLNDNIALANGVTAYIL